MNLIKHSTLLAGVMLASLGIAQADILVSYPALWNAAVNPDRFEAPASFMAEDVTAANMIAILGSTKSNNTGNGGGVFFHDKGATMRSGAVQDTIGSNYFIFDLTFADGAAFNLSSFDFSWEASSFLTETATWTVLASTNNWTDNISVGSISYDSSSGASRTGDASFSLSSFTAL